MQSRRKDAQSGKAKKAGSAPDPESQVDDAVKGAIADAEGSGAPAQDDAGEPTVDAGKESPESGGGKKAAAKKDDEPKKDEAPKQAKKDAPEKGKDAPKQEASKKESSESGGKKAAAKKDDASEQKPSKDDEPKQKAKKGDAPKPTSKRKPKPVAEPPRVRASARYVRVAPRKARLVADQVRGMHIEDARALLDFSPRNVAVDLKKLIESAAANAENNHELIGDEMRITEIRVDEGPTIKRFRPRALGRATRIDKRTSHISVALSPEE